MDWVEDILSKLHIYTLYYMTAIDNLPSIMRLGILSYNQAKRFEHRSLASEDVQSLRDATITMEGRSIHDYVPLYFTTRTPMQYNITKYTNQRAIEEADLVFIEINAFKVFKRSGVVFSDGNVAASKTKLYYKPDDLFKLDWQRIRFPNIYSLIRNDWEWKRVKQSEVLVPDSIPNDFFNEIVVFNKKALYKVKRKCKGINLLPKISVSSKWMIDSSHYLHPG